MKEINWLEEFERINIDEPHKPKAFPFYMNISE